jgi:hypothetical protein
MFARTSLQWLAIAFVAAIAPAADAPPVQLTNQQDHQRMMELLGMKSIRPGVNGNDKTSPNYANYDEAKANPYPKLPDPLVMKNGRKVTSAKMWWDQRRPELVEEFDREI